jgi:transposase-like protein
MDKSKIIEEYIKGKSMTAIAKEYGTHATTVMRILQKHHIELRHDATRKGVLSVNKGDELIEWAKAQGRPVTQKELAQLIGRTRLSHSYFIKYPELGKYVKSRERKALEDYEQTLYKWLEENDIPFKAKDRKTLNGTTIDALLLGSYSNTVLHLFIKPKFVSKKLFEKRIATVVQKTTAKRIRLILLNEDQIEHLDRLKEVLDTIKA